VRVPWRGVSAAVHPDGSAPALQDLVDRFDEAVGEVEPLRDVISASWERCVQLGLRPERFVVPYDTDIDTAGRFAWAAGPVIDRVGADLEETPMGLVLADQRGRILVRRSGSQAVGERLDRIQLAPGFLYAENAAGTNAIGTAIQRRGASIVQGPEHFADALIAMACTAITVTDPATGHLLGVVDLTCAAGDVSPLMLPLAKRIAWEIEQRLLEDTSVDEHVLREQFLKARRMTRAPLVVLNERSMMMNTTAASIVQSSDRELIWDAVVRALNAGKRDSIYVVLPGGRQVTIGCEPVLDGARLVGSLVHFETGSAPPRGTGGRRAPADGWSSLTRAEQAVAEHVALGMTNAEAGARLFLSPHTIDYHLRQVFRKLDVRSRVELTRAVVERRARQPTNSQVNVILSP
jgi:DNA-binding CsgD family transcriptional regulator